MTLVFGHDSGKTPEHHSGSASKQEEAAISNKIMKKREILRCFGQALGGQRHGLMCKVGVNGEEA